MSYTITLTSNAEDIGKALADMVRKQIPYATSQAVNALAKQVKLYEQKNLLEKFPSSTPFTVSSVSMTYAKKSDPTATVFMKPIAANYMRPYEEGGQHWLGGKKGLLVPRKQPVNTYGNLPRSTLANLKTRKDVFVGSVKTSRGKVHGVWQRPYVAGKRRGRVPAGANRTDKLKLLIQFTDSPQVGQELNWGHMAEATVRSRWKREFEKELAKALKTAK